MKKTNFGAALAVSSAMAWFDRMSWKYLLMPGGSTVLANDNNDPPEPPPGASEDPKQVAKLQKQVTALQAKLEDANGTIELLKKTGSGDEEMLEKLEKENADLRQRLATSAAADVQRAADEKLIGEKTSKGLTRDQAIAVIKRQKEHDAALAEKRAGRLPRLKEIIGQYKNNPTEARKQARIEFMDLDGSEWKAALESK